MSIEAEKICPHGCSESDGFARHDGCSPACCYCVGNKIRPVSERIVSRRAALKLAADIRASSIAVLRYDESEKEVLLIALDRYGGTP